MLTTQLTNEEMLILQRLEVPFKVLGQIEHTTNLHQAEVDATTTSVIKVECEKCRVVNLFKRIEKASKQTA